MQLLLEEQKRPVWKRIMSWRMSLRWFRVLTVANAISIFFLIVLGGAVRATDSGRGCGGDWPMCDGHLLPSLEYHQLVEWNHRLFATLGGFLMVVTVLSTLLWFRQPRRLMWLALAGAFTYIMQAILGGITVLLNLDESWIAAHMGNSMLLLASVTLLAFFTFVGPLKIEEKRKSFKWLSAIVLVWTYIAMFTGSAIVGAQADTACSNWPDCSPQSMLPETWPQWINFGHRIAVGFSDVLLVVLAFMILFSERRKDKRLMKTTRILGALYLSQVFLGGLTVLMGAPEFLKGAHLALAAASWASMAVMTVLVWAGPKVPAVNTGNNTGGSAGGGKRLKLTRAQGWQWLPEPMRNYLGLMRLNVVPLLLVPTVASMLMAAVQHPTDRNLFGLILLTMLGGTLATGGAHTLNQYIERDLDAKMKRTKRRAIVSGRVSPNQALAFGLLLTVGGVIELWLTVNFLAAALSLFGNMFYVVVYTMWLKRTTAQNIVIGGAAGAVPPLVGWAAVTGGIGLPAILFFAIIFFWTPAHFWALSLVRQEDYLEAGVPMLPVVKGERYTRLNILAYSILLLVVTLIPFALHALSWLYFVAAISLGMIFVEKAFELVRKGSTARAWKLFKFSNNYLAILYVVMVVDRLMAFSR